MSYPAPILNLNFANAKQLVNPAVAFSRASIGSEWDSNGIMRYVGAGVPRFDHDPLTGICRGLLVEPAVTFLNTYSDQIGHAANNAFGVTVSSDAWIALDGTLTMDKLVELATSGEHRISSTVSSPPSSAHVVDIEIKKTSGGRNVRLLLADATDTTNVISAIFNPDTGAWVTPPTGVGNASEVNGGIIALPSGIYRVWISGKPNNSGTQVLGRINITNGSSASYLGDTAFGVLFRRFLTYLGTGPTTTLETVASGVTRADDVCSVDLTQLKDLSGNPLWNGREGTVVVDAIILDNPAASTYLPIIVIDDGSLNNRIGIYHNGTTRQVYTTMRVSAAEQLSLSSGSAILQLQRFKVAISFAKDNSAMSVSGSTIQSDSSCNIPNGLATLRLCRDSAGNAAPRIIRSVQIYNRRIADAYLPALSAL